MVADRYFVTAHHVLNNGHPRNPDDVRIGVSTAGVWASTDAGASWEIINQGMYNEYMPPELQGDPIQQDIHRLAHCPALVLRS